MRFAVNHFNINNVKLVLVNPNCVTFIRPIPSHYIISLFKPHHYLIWFYSCNLIIVSGILVLRIINTIQKRMGLKSNLW